jgi:hypothetical protein
MTLERKDKDFRHEGISYLDYKQVEMDRVLTGFLARLWWSGQSSVIFRDERNELTTELIVRMMADNPESCKDVDPAVTYLWVETHLLDLVSRGKLNQAVAGLRPLHGFTYRFRNARRSRAYNADEQLYEMLNHASEKGRLALSRLKDFFFSGVDARTEAPRLGDDIDVETQALISLSEIIKLEITDRPSHTARRSYPPLYPEAADLLADDVLRLLFHRDLIPRTVLVEYLKILFAFHLALYHLKIMKLLPAMVREERPTRVSAGFFLDATGLPNSDPARLAERSVAAWYDRIPAFVGATFTVKKLNDVADNLARRNQRRNQLPRSQGGLLQVSALLSLLDTRYRKERQAYAAARLSAIDAARTVGEDDDPVVTQLLQLGIDDFATYIEVITHYRVSFHRRYLTDCLDSLLLKNRPGAMVAQPRLGQRRFTLDSRMLEVLLQLALLRGSDDKPMDLRTVPLRIDEFLEILRERYGLYIDQLPDGDGFGPAIVTDHSALRENRVAFIARLREIGFYSDLSDAYLAQTITPRYEIKAES